MTAPCDFLEFANSFDYSVSLAGVYLYPRSRSDSIAVGRCLRKVQVHNWSIRLDEDGGLPAGTSEVWQAATTLYRRTRKLFQYRSSTLFRAENVALTLALLCGCVAWKSIPDNPPQIQAPASRR